MPPPPFFPPPQVIETRENTRAARKKLHELHRRIVMEKMILYMVITTLTLIDCLLLYRLATNKGKLF